MRTYSVSQLNKFMTCPYQYHLSRQGVATVGDKSDKLIQGDIIHTGLAACLHAMSSGLLREGEWGQYVKDSWVDWSQEQGEKENQVLNEYGDIALEIIKRTNNQLDFSTWETDFTERQLTSTIQGDIGFTGIIDWWGFQDNFPVLIDWKTVKDLSDWNKEFHGLQLAAYFMLLADAGLLEKQDQYHAKIIQIKRKLYKKETTPFLKVVDFYFSREEILNWADIITGLISRIELRDKSKHPAWFSCPSCDFKAKCYFEITGKSSSNWDELDMATTKFMKLEDIYRV